MSMIKKLRKQNTLRWFFLGIGIIAVLALTTLNVYSLYALRESTVESFKDNKKNQIDEFAEQVRTRFTSNFYRMVRLNTEQLQHSWEVSGTFPNRYNKILVEALDDSLYTDVYFFPGNDDVCSDDEHSIYKFDPSTQIFIVANDVPQISCDGFSIAVSRTQVALNEYRFSNRVTFDAHRSMTITFINTKERSVIGHINLLVDNDYLVNSYFDKELKNHFGPAEKTGIVVWLRDWMQDEILTGSDDSYTYDQDVYEIDIRQRFPNMLDNWSLRASFLESPTLAASNASLTRNLIVLGFAVIALFGALVFMFINAQRERELAQRQAGFLANITHELKTPLAVMQAAGENIADGRVTDGSRLKNYGDHIYSESVRLRKMIEKLLDVAKVDAGLSMVEQTPLKVDEIVKQFYESTQSYVKAKGFTYELNIEDNLPLVMADPNHLETILNNLLENAVKYSSKEKFIQISARSNNDTVQISVKDKGDGIPKKLHKLIFEKFYRAENSLTAKTKGHGLGLSIVQNLIELNGGSIAVESKEEMGSTFIVSLPILFNKPSFDENENTVSTEPIDTKEYV